MSTNEDIETNLLTRVEIEFGIEGFRPMYHYEEILSPKRLSSNDDILIMCKERTDSVDAEYFQEIDINTLSESFWGITPEGESDLIYNLRNSISITFYQEFEFTNEYATGDDQSFIREYSYSKELSPTEANNIANILENGENNEVSISNILPQVIYIPNFGNVEEICDSLSDGQIVIKGNSNSNDTDTDFKYWGINSDSGGVLSFYIRNADVPKSSISEIAVSMGGIAGLYIGVIWAIARFLRISVNELAGSIMEEELPNVDMLLSIIEDILWAQKEQNLELEEELFDELIDIFRSSEKLIFITGARAKRGNYNYHSYFQKNLNFENKN
ncbi:hypothetical protein M0812_29823 [Anaeramoeba flamelloides]|uniref:Piezo non-specific cation channel cap domain-containing protein n=1 Tax=Anaeramoeba flamelloides TaxID=1746091 RepID=A0AAV7Y6B6_9EUKA|nr:hypothetical protein M0812_29823 [Anaeramoeba flamelloides]